MNENIGMKEMCFPPFFLECLQRLHCEERHLIDLLSIIADAVSLNELRTTLNEHMDSAFSYINRLADVFEITAVEEDEILYSAIPEITTEVDRIVIQTEYGSDLRNAALTIVARKALHHEMASYSKLIDFLILMGEIEISKSLMSILGEEKIIDAKLATLENDFIDKITRIPGSHVANLL